MIEADQVLFDRLHESRDLSLANEIEREYVSKEISFPDRIREALFCDSLAAAFCDSLTADPGLKRSYLLSSDPVFYKPVLLASKATMLLTDEGEPQMVGGPREELATIYGNLGCYYSLQGRYCESLRAFNRALSISPGNGDIRFNKIIAAKDYLPALIRFADGRGFCIGFDRPAVDCISFLFKMRKTPDGHWTFI